MARALDQAAEDLKQRFRRSRTCDRCGAELNPSAQFCGECGQTTREKKRERAETRQADRGTVAALVVAFGGTLVALVVGYALFELGVGVTGLLVASNLLFVGVGVAAVLLLGKGAWRESFAEQPDELGVLLGLVAIPVCLAMNIAYVYTMQSLVGTSEVTFDVEASHPFFLIIAGAVLPALLEEWVDRGVIWTACMRATTEGRTIFLTAGLFALSHGLNGGFLLELPHRFAMGLVLGWLRARTGSLLPCVLAHFGNNLVAIALF